MFCPITNAPSTNELSNGDFEWFIISEKRFAVSGTAIAVASHPENLKTVREQRKAIIEQIRSYNGPGNPMIVTGDHPGVNFSITSKE